MFQEPLPNFGNRDLALIGCCNQGLDSAKKDATIRCRQSSMMTWSLSVVFLNLSVAPSSVPYHASTILTSFTQSQSPANLKATLLTKPSSTPGLPSRTFTPLLGTLVRSPLLVPQWQYLRNNACSPSILRQEKSSYCSLVPI